jgi:hypothetical protein
MLKLVLLNKKYKMYKNYYKYKIIVSSGIEIELDDYENEVHTDNYENIQIPDNQPGFENRQSYKIDSPKKLQELRNSARASTLIKINNETINLENTEYGHDISHIIAEQFCKYFPKDIELLCNEFPTVFPNKESFYSFQPSGELIPEIIDTIFKEGKINQDYKLSISEDNLNIDSEYWSNKIIRERQTDMRQIRQLSIKDTPHLESPPNKEKIIQLLLTEIIPNHVDQKKLLIENEDTSLNQPAHRLIQEMYRAIRDGEQISKYSQIFVDFNKGKFNNSPFATQLQN